MRIAIVDGLGHGPAAAEAATAATDALRDKPDLDPAAALHACDRALRGTRGAAASVLWIDGSRVVFAGVGNVDGRIFNGSAAERRCSPDRGVLGRGIRAPHVLEFPLGEDWTVVLHSDGISSRAEISELKLDADVETIARSALERWARPTDDATIVIARRL
ncbi:MAG: SpoIIE family protein phosphatase [Chloroflexota bacterium]